MVGSERQPAVSGQFYPGDHDELHAYLEQLESASGSPKGGSQEKILGVVVPHAGYIYSGKTAMAAYKALRDTKLRRFVLVGPNHESYPHYTSVYSSGTWRTPLGSVKVDEQLAQDILSSDTRIVDDTSAHKWEHSLEVQVPFLQHMFGQDFSICPIIMGNQSREEATALAESLEKIGVDFTLIISSDLTHYENLESANRKDSLIINEIISLDVGNFYEALKEHEVSACGFGPIAVLMHYTKAKGGKIELIEHTTSYDRSGDSKNVVGYGALIAHRQ